MTLTTKTLTLTSDVFKKIGRALRTPPNRQTERPIHLNENSSSGSRSAPSRLSSKALSLLALLFFAAPLEANDKLTIVLDWFVNPDHGPIIVAQELGFFGEQGLEVDVIAPADPSDSPKLVAAGKADLAISYQPTLHLQISEGLPLLRVGTLVATPLNCLIALEDGPIKTPADLKGRRVGVSVGGVEDASLGIILKKYGLTLDDVEIVNVNWALSPSLMTRQVDAIIGAYRNFELNQMDIEGVPARAFYVEEEGLPPYDELVYVAHSERMNKERIRKFLTATEKATQYIVNHPDKSWEIFSGTSRELADELNKRAWYDTFARFALRPAAMDEGRYANYEKFLFEAGLVPSKKPVSSIAIDITKQ